MDINHKVQYTRKAGPVVIEAARADWLQEITQVITSKGSAASTAIVSDLSLGAWRNQQIASEFMEQLGGNCDSKVALGAQAAFDGKSSSIGFWIDAETRGDTAKLEALKSVKAVVNALVSHPAYTLLVIAPRFGQSWGSDNEFFLYYLASCLSDGPHRLLVTFSQDESVSMLRSDLFQLEWLESAGMAEGLPKTSVETNPLYSYYPGVIDAHLAIDAKEMKLKESGCYPLQNGSLLIPPEIRKSPSQITTAEVNALVPLTRERGWIASYLMYWLPEGIPDFGVLIREAWYRLSEGCSDIAFKFMQRTLEAAFNEGMQAAFQIQYQWMRIASHRFKDAGDIDDPSEMVEANNRGILYWQKAWGLVMSGRPLEARERFEKAKELLRFKATEIERIYFLNIYALSLLLTGDFAGAMSLEREIEQMFKNGEVQDWHMAYVNNLNIARLLRRKGDLEEARRYYGKAFNTTEGARNGIDGLYINACMALLSETQEQYQEAFWYWFRACLHWVALEYPETLGWRVLEAIKAERRDKKESLDNPEEVSITLLEILSEAARKGGVSSFSKWLEAADEIEPPVFISDELLTSTDTAPVWESVIGGEGWGLLASQEYVPPVFEGSAYRMLREVLYSAMRSLCPALDLSAYKTFGVDDRGGAHMPGTRHELMELGMLRGVDKLAFGSASDNLSVTRVSDLAQEVIVHLGSAVRAVEPDEVGGRVSFSRYFSPQCLNDREFNIVQAVSTETEGIALVALSQGVDVTAEHWALLQSLCERRVVDLRLPVVEDAGRPPY